MAINNQVSTATNLQGPNVNAAPGTSNTNIYFNNLYSVNMSTGPANDALVAFFEEYTSNKQAADNLAAAVLYTATAQQLNPMQVLADFKKLPAGDLSNYLIAFLNINRIPTSLIGVKTGLSTNPVVARTIVA
jgi:hypothetical protein